MASLPVQLCWLFVLALVAACIAWTVTHEEIFREAREVCRKKSETARQLAIRKFFYMLTCEYCFSHYVVAAVLVMTRYRLLIDDWRGYVIAFFAMTAIANLYLSLYGMLRVDIKSERLTVAAKEEALPEADIK
jgi:hypothetical protein